ncbi:uncharacterized protein LOC110463460 [Mizuhopecten yessoensis]|uniref:Uncharacterized protein n=1 Tax=Mizuhopecten yessoensis TaxID=6573 RepID=A0A210PW29_MIZYE|nr:uncharacterized protein LOC110463460 [Mizuhopecten yessoensis]XP_021373750.1 uncharacterized protein LOC110463460 [Mizuhopecten yessoensis]XP_021373751.1 uncharacterized protein LOC110463460 [Mizuhopecten yessoensis]OWF40676.1 hypothetical protein KP79_PYT19201 [Mizuhopecten yessoensis]
MDPPEWMQSLENDMVVELSKHLSPGLKERWADFDCRLKTYLSPVCRANLTNIHQAFDALKNKEDIRIGDYKVLRDMVNPIHVKMGDIIDDYTARMQAGNGEPDTKDTKVNDMEASEKMKKLENEMAVELNKHLHPRLQSKWADFDNLLSGYLDEACRAGLENIFMVIDELSNMEKISIGNYTVLREMVTPIHVDMRDIIDKYTAKIILQFERERMRDVNQ